MGTVRELPRVVPGYGMWFLSENYPRPTRRRLCVQIFPGNCLEYQGIHATNVYKTINDGFDKKIQKSTIFGKIVNDRKLEYEEDGEKEEGKKEFCEKKQNLYRNWIRKPLNAKICSWLNLALKSLHRKNKETDAEAHVVGLTFAIPCWCSRWFLCAKFVSKFIVLTCVFSPAGWPNQWKYCINVHISAKPKLQNLNFLAKSTPIKWTERLTAVDKRNESMDREMNQCAVP